MKLSGSLSLKIMGMLALVSLVTACTCPHCGNKFIPLIDGPSNGGSGSGEVFPDITKGFLTSENEPNDSVTDAQLISLNDKVTGKLGFTHGDNEDWYKVQINSEGKLGFRVKNTIKEGVDHSLMNDVVLKNHELKPITHAGHYGVKPNKEHTSKKFITVTSGETYYIHVTVKEPNKANYCLEVIFNNY